MGAGYAASQIKRSVGRKDRYEDRQGNQPVIVISVEL
jgi:hypothetical protein